MDYCDINHGGAYTPDDDAPGECAECGAELVYLECAVCDGYGATDPDCGCAACGGNGGTWQCPDEAHHDDDEFLRQPESAQDNYVLRGGL